MKSSCKGTFFLTLNSLKHLFSFPLIQKNTSGITKSANNKTEKEQNYKHKKNYEKKIFRQNNLPIFIHAFRKIQNFYSCQNKRKTQNRCIDRNSVNRQTLKNFILAYHNKQKIQYDIKKKMKHLCRKRSNKKLFSCASVFRLHIVTPL